MILNANIPLSTSPTIRQPRWRIGLFLGLAGAGILMGWLTTKRLFTGISTPKLQTPSGVTIRTTPEHNLWIATHMGGLSINTACPIDLPTLIAKKTPSWIVFGDTGTKTQTVILGEIPDALKNYEIAFNCAPTSIKNGYTLQEKNATPPEVASFFPFHTPDGWAWEGGAQTTINVYDRGLNIALPQQNKEKTFWPEQTLTTALPITPASFDILPETAQGLTDLFQKEKGISYFSWNNADGQAAAYTFSSTLTNDELIALFSVIGKTTTSEQKTFRDDNVSYKITVQEPLSLAWITDVRGEIRTKDDKTLGYITRQENVTLVSTAPTEWTVIVPHWEAPLGSTQKNIAHTPRTIANFGEQIFVTKHMFTIFQKEM